MMIKKEEVEIKNEVLEEVVVIVTHLR